MHTNTYAFSYVFRFWHFYISIHIIQTHLLLYMFRLFCVHACMCRIICSARLKSSICCDSKANSTFLAFLPHPRGHRIALSIRILADVLFWSICLVDVRNVNDLVQILGAGKYWFSANYKKKHAPKTVENRRITKKKLV